MCPRRKSCFLARAAICLGLTILGILILPRWFWWLLCGGILVAGGVLLLRR